MIEERKYIIKLMKKIINDIETNSFIIESNLKVKGFIKDTSGLNIQYYIMKKKIK